MTQLSLSGLENFRRTKSLASFILLALLLAACAQPNSSRMTGSIQLRNTASTGIIGGKPVGDTPEFKEKILYLALGAKMQKDASGSVRVSWNGHCTASAISKRIVLTAAHCVKDQSVSGLQTVLTQNPSESTLNLNEWYAADAVKVHEGYTGGEGFLNDLALIHLNRDLPEETLLQLASEEQVRLPVELTAIGYGTISESADPAVQAKTPTNLNYVIKFIASLDPEVKTFSINQSDHKGFCQGDSGGPGLIYDAPSGKYYIIGVVSNVSMLNEQKKNLDPDGKYNLCIGQGNYTNVLNPELQAWIAKNASELSAKSGTAR